MAQDREQYRKLINSPAPKGNRRKGRRRRRRRRRKKKESATVEKDNVAGFKQ